ncbi:hypothetical protein [Embleya sp. NPDC005971]|uniref:hypothetical protein n=1 Tax=Embleya sp. NPDC005971 TaxID=3156724 RepID=UPI0034080A05
MSSDYTPSPETAALFARYKRHLLAERELRQAVKDAAPAEMRAGGTVSDLAELTGMTREVFRRIAREHEIDRLRPPTHGKDAPPPAS